MSASDTLTWRQAANDHGFRIVPVATGRKNPFERSWPELARRRARPTSVDPRAANTGILCDGLRALDIDVDAPHLAASIRQAARALLGHAPIRVRADSPRVLFLYQATEGEPSKCAISGPRGAVEVLGRGQQFVADGHHPDGCQYEWPLGGPADIPRVDLPAIHEEQVADFLRRIAPVIGAPDPVEPPRAVPVASPSASIDSPDAFARSVLAPVAALISNAPNGDQDIILRDCIWRVGCRVAEGKIDRAVAYHALVAAAQRMPDFNPSRPWTLREIEQKIARGFAKAAANIGSAA